MTAFQAPLRCCFMCADARRFISLLMVVMYRTHQEVFSLVPVFGADTLWLNRKTGEGDATHDGLRAVRRLRSSSCRDCGQEGAELECVSPCHAALGASGRDHSAALHTGLGKQPDDNSTCFLRAAGRAAGSAVQQGTDDADIRHRVTRAERRLSTAGTRLQNNAHPDTGDMPVTRT